MASEPKRTNAAAHSKRARSCPTLLLVALVGCAPEPEPTEGGMDSPPWQAALRRGVDFRAHGQEPGWTLDIDREGSIVYIGDYGADTLTAPTPAPQRAGDEDVWAVAAAGRRLDVRVTERDCQDTMSGERFTHTVTLRIDGTALEGCGGHLRP